MSQVFGDPKRLVNDYMAGSHAIGIRALEMSEVEALEYGSGLVSILPHYPCKGAEMLTRKVLRPATGQIDVLIQGHDGVQ